MLIGYARISTQEQYLDLQVEALHAAGCIRFFKDEAPGGAAKGPPPGLARVLAALGAGDTLVVWRLDRLGRSLRELVRRVEAVQGRGRLGGRPKRMTPIQEICAALGVSKSTLYRYVGPDGSVRTPLDKVNPPHDST